MKPAEAAAELKSLARGAIVRANGNTEQARQILNERLIERNDAVLERELCSAYRNIALQTLLATHFAELRAEGKLPALRKRDQPIQTTDYERTRERPPKPSDFLWDEKTGGMMAAGHIRRYLDTFMVNGKPIGDCYVEEVDQAAAVREADVRFMRGLVAGLPPEGIVRELRTEEDAAKLWQATHA